MSTYLVQKRMKEDRVYLPGEILVDPDFSRTGLLMERGFITPVPDNYVPPSYVSGGREPESAGSDSLPADDDNQGTSAVPTLEQALEGGYSQEAAESLAAGEFTDLVEGETKALEELIDSEDSEPAIEPPTENVAEVGAGAGTETKAIES